MPGAQAHVGRIAELPVEVGALVGRGGRIRRIREGGAAAATGTAGTTRVGLIHRIAVGRVGLVGLGHVGLAQGHAGGADPFVINEGGPHLVVVVGTADAGNSTRTAGGVGRRGIFPTATIDGRPEQGGEDEAPDHGNLLSLLAQTRQCRGVVGILTLSQLFACVKQNFPHLSQKFSQICQF